MGDSCAPKHEPNKKGKGKGRLRSPSPTGSLHRNSKGEGEGSDAGSAKGTPKGAGKSPQGKAFVQTSRQEVGRRANHVISGMFSRMCNFLNLQEDASSETRMLTNIQLNLLMK